MLYEVITSEILTREAFDNAITVVHALSGSTNAVIHLVAMAGRAGIDLGIDRFDELARNVPVLANLRPAGAYLMEDFYYRITSYNVCYTKLLR